MKNKDRRKINRLFRTHQDLIDSCKSLLRNSALYNSNQLPTAETEEEKMRSPKPLTYPPPNEESFSCLELSRILQVSIHKINKMRTQEGMPAYRVSQCRFRYNLTEVILWAMQRGITEERIPALARVPEILNRKKNEYKNSLANIRAH